ncbi:ATPase family AAA domain-containing protein 5 [Merluccius polli]|uniref:ATPase family AAA domain-containing protein 5 n=1 Tax=Merluccius polli TaxID=89951 RepID=A0AA47MH11_MERPO|nr:ATPase family AAA domain-containing protein 5 [Merluccius polli]
MRNKLTRSKTAEVSSRAGPGGGAAGLLLPPEAESGGDHTGEHGGGCSPAADGRAINTHTRRPPTEESDAKTSPPGVFCTRPGGGESRDGGLPPGRVTPQGGGLQKLNPSPGRGLDHRYEAASSPLSCLREIMKSNPGFPARRVFSWLQRRTREDLGGLVSPGEKRKRPDEVDDPGKTSKRPRPGERSRGRPSQTWALSKEAVQGHPEPRPGRLSHTHRLKRLRQPGGLCDAPQPTRHADSETVSVSCGLNADAGVDNVLWTEKYSPRHSSEVIGNASSVNKVHSWLKKWRRRVNGGDRREEGERKRPQNDGTSWDRGDFQGEAGSEGEPREPPSNTLLITGPPGVGKTAAVYACALELGFKVFEVNCSSQRSGRCVLAQLKEVTQSHLVEAPGIEALRPAYFNNYNPHSSSSSKPDTVPGKNTSKTIVASTSKRKPVLKQGRSRRRRTPDPGAASLANFFKTKAKEPVVVASLPPENHEELCHPASRPDEAGQRDKRTAAMSLVLFEEVDIIFDDDVGFLSAIKTLMTTTKRPVVLTTSDPSFKERFERDMEEIRFKMPSAVNVCSYLRLVCLVENARTRQHEVAGLLAECQGDLRRCLLQLHFLVKSGASRTPQQADPPKQCVLGGMQRSKDGKENVKWVPLPADTAGYPASCQSWAEPENELLRVLTESWQRNSPLLYSNLELLLPLPATTQGTTNHYPDKEPNTGMHTEQPPPASQPPVQQQRRQRPGETVDLKSEKKRNGSRLSRRKGLSTVTDRCRSSPPDALKPAKAEGPQGSVAKTGDEGLDPPTRRGLVALTHFVDLMSYLDCHLWQLWSRTFPGRAEVKDGLMDEMREGGGERTWWQREMLSEIQAAVEGLAFHVYLGRLSAESSGAPTGNQEVGGMEWEDTADRLSLPGYTHRRGSGRHLFPQPCMAQRRFELSRAVLQNRSFRLLGSRRAVCLDYMAALRSICHHHRLLQEHDRFQNYLRSIHLGLSKATMQLLAEECMQ